MQIVIDFLNMPEDLEGLREFLVRCEEHLEIEGFSPELLDPNNPMGITWSLRLGWVEFQGSNKKFYLSGDKKDKVRRLFFLQDEIHVFPDDEEFGELWELARGLKQQYASFIDGCSKGEVDLNFLNRQDYLILGKEFKYVASPRDPFDVRPLIQSVQAQELLDGIVALDLVNDFLGGRGHEYQRIARCLNCNNYAAGKSTKRAYCSDTCKHAHYYRKRKDASHGKN